MRGRVVKNAFNGGEISRRMEARADLPGIYDRAVAKMLNYMATVEGPAIKRSGFRYIKAAAASSTWLTSFIFNTLQSYVLEWGEQVIRFFTNGGQIENAGAPLELAVPYAAAEAPRISMHQSYDRLYLAHPAHPPGMLSRQAAEQFAFNWIPLKNGPFKDWNTDKASTLTWTGSGLVDGTATITATKGIFKPGHVGGAFIFEVHDFSTVAAWEPEQKATAMAVGTLRRSDGKVYSAQGFKGPGSPVQPYTGTIQPTHIEGEEWDGSGDIVAGTTNDVAGVLWRYEYDRFGAGMITKVLSATKAEIKVTRRLPTTDATYHWAHGCFSQEEGWPHLVTVWGNRLIFFKGVEVVGSVVGDYFNFSPITDSGLFAPDMAFRLALGIKDPPLWVHADKEYLLAGCAREEIVVGVINRAAGLSSDNLMAQPQSYYGSAEVWPVNVGTGLLFVQRGARKIREAQYAYTEERFAGVNVNIFARHITRSGVKWLAFQQEPEEMLWGGRGDGALIAHPHSPEQEVKGFARAELAGGSAIAGVSIPSQDGASDELWILAELAGGAKGILQLAPWWDEDAGTDQADAFFVDWGVSYDGDPIAEINEGLDHLVGLEVRILADGDVLPPQTVASSAPFLTFGKAYSKIHVGLGYDARIKFLRPEIRGTQTAQGARARIIRLIARLIDSGPLRILDARGALDLMFGRPKSAPIGTAPPLFNGDTPNVATGDGSDYDVSSEIVSSDPLPSIVSMAIGTYDLEELQR
jgi:hypothetical protein